MAVAIRFNPLGAGRDGNFELAQGEWSIDGVPVTATAAQINAAAIDNFAWQLVTGTTQLMLPNLGYIDTNNAPTNFYLPTAIAAGQVVRVAGHGSGGWKINQATGQQVIFGTVHTTTGVTGYLASTSNMDSLELVCIQDNVLFSVVSAIGNINLV